MAQYRENLPQLQGGLFLTDGGIETTLIFHDGLELPDFAAFHLLKSSEGEAALLKYFRTYAALARQVRSGLILESATWRANRDWATKLGYTVDALAEANRRAIRLLEQVRAEVESEQTVTVLSGCVGPRGDGYIPAHAMSEGEAESYHLEQIDTFASSAADMITAITMNYVEEAVGIARAAQRVNLPCVISFTVETDGRLPTGQTLKDAIETVDARTSSYPAYYMINCAHPSHFEHVLADAEPWMQRIRGLRANASRKSHTELNEATVLDIGNPEELGADYSRLLRSLPQLNVVGGCCGTDHRHVERIAESCSPLFAAPV